MLWRVSGGQHGHMGDRPACELHEPLMRSHGGSIVDEANAVPVCRECHRQIHDHPAQSYACGLLVRDGIDSVQITSDDR